ncbi:hypothetical protein FACS1894217_13730 [Clostridia bacterium]|nr:hypothetical protein FACS1894217_13730 [Clostridia bacterium]
MYNPQVNNFAGLLNAIDIMKPMSFEFFVGKNSPMDDGYKYNKDEFKNMGILRHNTRHILGIEHTNIIIRGEIFDIYCRVDTSCICSVVNVIHLHMFKRPYFEEKNVGGARVFNERTNSVLKLIYSLLRGERPIHETVLVTGERYD